jgi:hypothetical protein
MTGRQTSGRARASLTIAAAMRGDKAPSLLPDASIIKSGA